MTIREEKQQVLKKVCEIVPFDGWSEQALRHAREELGLNAGQMANLFPKGVSSVISFFFEESNRILAQTVQNEDLNSLPIRARLSYLFEKKLDLWQEDKEILGLLLPKISLPLYYGSAAKTLWHDADTLWYLAGDRATDYNRYTKRVLLLPIYAHALKIWVKTEDGTGRKQALAHFEKRLDQVVSVIGKIKKASKGKR